MLVFPFTSRWQLWDLVQEKESYFKYFIVSLKNLPALNENEKNWLTEEQTDNFFVRTKIKLGNI